MPVCIERLADEGDGAFALVAKTVIVGVVDDVDVGSLRQGTAIVCAIPALVDVVGVEDLHAAAVEDDHAVVGKFFTRMVELGTEDGDAFIVGGRCKGVGYPQNGVVVAGSGGFGCGLLRLCGN